LLTFVTKNGDFTPTVLELSRAMRARVRMGRLSRLVWQEKPLVVEGDYEEPMGLRLQQAAEKLAAGVPCMKVSQDVARRPRPGSRTHKS